MKIDSIIDQLIIIDWQFEGIKFQLGLKESDNEVRKALELTSELKSKCNKMIVLCKELLIYI